MNKGKPDVEPDAPMWRYHALQFEHGVAKELAFGQRMNLDEIIENDCARRSVKEKHFFDEWIAFEGKLVEIVLPGLRWFVSQNTSEGQAPFFQRKRSQT